MPRLRHLLCLSVTACALGCSDPPTDAEDTFTPRCDALESDYLAAVEAARTCTQDSDCQVIEGTGTCDCAHSWGLPAGDAVNVSFTYPEDWRRRLDACRDSIPTDGTCDAAPATNPRCSAGVCVATDQSCLGDPFVPDAGHADAS